MTIDDLLPTPAAAERLGVERSTLSRWVTLGRIAPRFRAPGSNGVMLFAPADLDRLAADIATSAERTEAPA